MILPKDRCVVNYQIQLFSSFYGLAKWKVCPSEILKSSFNLGWYIKEVLFNNFLTMAHIENNHLPGTYTKKMDSAGWCG